MSRGSKKLAPAEPVGEELGPLTPQAQADEAVINGAEQQLLDHAETLISTGRIQVFDFYQKLTRVAATKEFTRLRESKKYKGLPYRDANGNMRRVADLEEFCEELLGRSYRSVAEDAQNMNMLGEEAYQISQTLGLTARDFRDIRALPPSDRELVKQAVAAQNREHVIDVMEQLIEKHLKETEQLRSDVAERDANLEASRKVNTRANEKINTLEEKLERKRGRPAADEHAELLANLNGAVMDAGGALLGVERAVKDIVDLERAPDHLVAAGNDALVQLVKRIWQIAQNQPLPVDLAELKNEIWPEWMAEAEATRAGGHQ